MELIRLENEMPIFNPEARTIHEFNVLIKRSRAPGVSYNIANREATKRLAYLYFMVHWGSNYVDRHKDVNERSKKVIHDLKIDPSFNDGDDYVIAALQKYEEMTSTVTSDVLIAAKRAVLKLEGYFNAVNFEERDSKGQLLWSPKLVIDTIKNLKGMVGGLYELEKDIKKEQVQGKGQIKGGGTQGDFEDDDETEFQTHKKDQLLNNHNNVN